MGKSYTATGWKINPTALGLITSGEKTMEGRVGYYYNRGVETGDIVYLRCDALPSWEWMVRITDVSEYPGGTTFRDVVDKKNYRKLVPLADSLKTALGVLDGSCNRSLQERFGVVLFGMEYTGAHIW